MVAIPAEFAPRELVCINCFNLKHGSHSTGFSTALVNQGSATKVKRVGYASYNYPLHRPLAEQVWNLFLVTPRKHVGAVQISVLERHPYTTQTFVPLGASGADIEFMVVVADDKEGRPDPDTIRAWLCHGNQLGMPAGLQSGRY